MASKTLTVMLAFLSISILITIGEVYTQEYDYTDGPNGPAHWGDLSPAWALCSTGQEQSPIDIHTACVEVPQDAQYLQTHYNNSNAVLTIGKHGIQVSWLEDDGGSITINDTIYAVTQFHFHHPSEHTIDGVRFPLEMHVVHTSSDGNSIAVVGLLFYIGPEEDTFLAEVVTGRIASMLQNNQTVEEIGLVRMNYPEYTEDYYRYQGSLTTPPCSEGVTWTLMTTRFSITLSQLDAIKQAMPDPNARPLQLIDGRSVFLYQPSSLKKLQASGHADS